ncbi:unnamed protein product, partial [Adineta ricciae]
MTEIVQNRMLGTRRKLELLLQEMDTICREMIVQMHNSTTNRTANVDIQALVDMFIERQNLLTEQ